jgi:hypothetical protein
MVLFHISVYFTVIEKLVSLKVLLVCATGSYFLSLSVVYRQQNQLLS